MSNVIEAMSVGTRFWSVTETEIFGNTAILVRTEDGVVYESRPHVVLNTAAFASDEEIRVIDNADEA